VFLKHALVAEGSIGNAAGLPDPATPGRTNARNTTLASTQQTINDGFDVNQSCVEKLDACVAGAQ
jgi:hypothetical protein